MNLKKLVDWHKGAILKVQEISGLSNYQLLWVSAAKGLVVGYIIGACL